MVGDFCIAARACAECNNFILEDDLEDDLGGDLGGTPQVSINFGIPNRCIEHKLFRTVLYCRSAALKQVKRYIYLTEFVVFDIII